MSKSKIIIVGAGVIGLTLAVELVQNGIDIICVDSGIPGELCSNYSLGIVYPISPLTADKKLVNISIEAYEQYPSYLTQLCQITKSQKPMRICDLIEVALEEKEMNAIFKTIQAYREYGVNLFDIDGKTVKKLIPSISNSVIGASVFEKAIHIHTEEFINILVNTLLKLKGQLLTNTFVQSILIKNGECIGIKTESATFYADAVIIASGADIRLLSSISNWTPENFLTPIRGQILYLKNSVSDFVLNHMIYTKYLDIVPRANNALLVGSTVENVGFNKSATVSGVNYLLSHLMNTFSIAQDLTIHSIGVGLRPKTIDEIPIVGKVSKFRGLFISTGHYKNGIYLAPSFAKLLVNSILEEKYEDEILPYTPDRFVGNDI